MVKFCLGVLKFAVFACGYAFAGHIVNPVEPTARQWLGVAIAALIGVAQGYSGTESDPC